MDFRKAAVSDLDAISRIYEDVHTAEENGFQTIGWIRGVYPTRKTAEDSVARGDMFVLDDEGIVGAAIINRTQVDVYEGAPWENETDQVCVLHTLVISPASAGKGYGKAFVAFYEQWAMQHGLWELRMDTNARNQAARNLYQKLGYKEIAIVPTTFNGIPGVDLVLLEKALRPSFTPVSPSKETHMNDKWLDFAIRIQSIAQAGLQYGKDKYDKERYEELRQIAAEMVSLKTDIPVEKVRGLFCNESGYQTPKIDTRAAVFMDGKILLVHENNGTWSLPGGWCDVDQSIASNTEKEVLEEAGFTVRAEKLIAVQDWRKHNVFNYVYGVVKTFLLCRYVSGEFQDNIETTEIGFFGRDQIPEGLAAEKTTREQILMCFDAYDHPSAPTLFE